MPKAAPRALTDKSAHLRSADDTPTDPTETTHIGWAQMSLLRAIYHELRPGNDLTKQNATALKEHTN